jgi:hypothetical protein
MLPGVNTYGRHGQLVWRRIGRAIVELQAAPAAKPN